MLWHNPGYGLACAYDLVGRAVETTDLNDPLFRMILAPHRWSDDAHVWYAVGQDLKVAVAAAGDGAVVHRAAQRLCAARAMYSIIGQSAAHDTMAASHLLTQTTNARDLVRHVFPDALTIFARWRVLDVLAPKEVPDDETMAAATAAWLANEYTVAAQIVDGAAP